MKKLIFFFFVLLISACSSHQVGKSILYFSFSLFCLDDVKEGLSEEINFGQENCFQNPRLNVILRPKRGKLEKSKAIFVYLPPEGYPLADRYAALVYQAALKEGVFEALEWGGRYTHASEERALKKKARLFILENFEIFAPTKVTPGKLALALRLFDPRQGYSIWRLTGEVDLCPHYPKDRIVSLTKSEAPLGNLTLLNSAFFELAGLTIRLMYAP